MHQLVEQSDTLKLCVTCVGSDCSVYWQANLWQETPYSERPPSLGSPFIWHSKTIFEIICSLWEDLAWWRESPLRISGARAFRRMNRLLRPPLLPDHFLVSFRVVSHCRIHCTDWMCTKHSWDPLHWIKIDQERSFYTTYLDINRTFFKATFMK